MLFFAKIIRIDEIMKSRDSKMIKAHTFNTLIFTKQDNTEKVNILSEIGSRIFPELVTLFTFLAIKPSRKSVIDANINEYNAKI